VPRETLGYDALAKAIAKRNSLWSAGLIKSVLLEMREEIKEQLINGNKVVLENSFTYHLSLSARLDSPDATMPPASEVVKIQISASKTFADEVKESVQLERLAPENKVPVISAVKDTLLGLLNVLNPDGVLQLVGADMLFDPAEEGSECVLTGTRSGQTLQTLFAKRANTEVLIVPKVTTQTDFWNNEYSISLSTRYTEHGSIRTGTYSKMLRTPLKIDLGENHNVGILSGPEDAPLVEVTAVDMANVESAWVRIQALLSAHDGELRLSLLDMTEGGNVGNAIMVSENGEYILSGFAGSDLSSLTLQVNDYAALKLKVQTVYTGRLVDILNVLYQGS
jgi:hypothetical protein